MPIVLWPTVGHTSFWRALISSPAATKEAGPLLGSCTTTVSALGAFLALRVHNHDHYGAPTTQVGNQAKDPGTQSANPASHAHREVHKTPLWVSLCQERYGRDHKKNAAPQWHVAVGTRFGR